MDEVSPQLLREVEFGERFRGYSPSDVDELLERVATHIEDLQAQLRQLRERATASEQRLEDERHEGDELRRTLVLARRTADAAIEEARTEAAGMVADAERYAAELRESADTDAARVRREADEYADASLEGISERRRLLEADVEALTAYVDGQRTRLHEELQEQLRWIEQPGRLSMPPVPELSPPETMSPLPGSEAEAEAASGPPAPALFDDDAEDTGEQTAIYDVVAMEREEQAATGADDSLMADLRRAVSDEPPGP
jgi:cell division initiation protein